MAVADGDRLPAAVALHFAKGVVPALRTQAVVVQIGRLMVIHMVTMRLLTMERRVRGLHSHIERRATREVVQIGQVAPQRALNAKVVVHSKE